MGETSRRERSRTRSRSPSRRHGERSGDQAHRSGRRDGDDDKSHHHNHRPRSRDRRDETEEERRERKRHKREKEQRREDKEHRREQKRRRREGVDVVDDDEDGDMWVEKSVDAEGAASYIPTKDSLPLKSNVTDVRAPLPPSTVTGSSGQERDAWMLDPNERSNGSSSRPDTSAAAHSNGMTDDYGDEAHSSRNAGGGMDFFSSLGTEHKRKEAPPPPDPSKALYHDKELNKQLLDGKGIDEYEVKEKKTAAGGPGYQWRMMKLRRLYEQAEEQGRKVEDVAMERYGNLEEFEEALEERRVLDERESRKQMLRQNTNSDGAGGYNSGASSGMRTPDVGGRRFMFSGDDSRPPSRAGFRRPGEAPETSTPGPSRVDQLKRTQSGDTPSGTYKAPPKVATPIPSVFTPTNLTQPTGGAGDYPFNQPAMADPTSSQPPLSLEQLNRLQAKVLRAKLMDDPGAESLEAEYERERARAEKGDEQGMWDGADGGLQGAMGRVEEDGTRVEVQVLPTLDGRGQLYDVGTGKEDEEVRRGNRRKKPEKFETRDREGNLLRYNADDDDLSLGELVRQEKFGAGARDQKNLDAEMASSIARDARYQDDIDYMDDNADKLARRKMKTDAMKRAFAIKDFARTKKALDTCPFCYQDDRPPLTAIVALGTRAYMCCTTAEELVEGHCYIVPLQHCLSSLEMEDDDWEEVRNFMKCLMRMHAKDNNGVLFYETILSFRQQRHTVIEAVPVPFDQFQDAPAYFRESILASESEWSQHKKLIDFSARPGGFRRSLVPNMPYFMVQWDYKGEKGYGHVIEGVDDAAGRGEGEDDMGAAMDEGDKGGGRFPEYFAAEIIGNILGLEARKWLKPRKVDYALNKERARKLGTKFQPYNWTVQLQQQ